MKIKIFVFLMCLVCPISLYAATSDTVEAKFSRCVDGDTAYFEVDGQTIKTRFLAIDTPETVHPTKDVELYGKDASEYTCKAITNAKKIILEYDKGSTKKDKYDRYLVWVFVDGELLQEKLVEIGYAEVAYLYGDYKYTTDLENAEEIARNNKVGIWSDNKVSSTVQEKEEEVTYKDILIYIGLIILSLVVGMLKKKKLI